MMMRAAAEAAELEEEAGQEAAETEHEVRRQSLEREDVRWQRREIQALQAILVIEM
jgi:hypothetical protein